MQRSTQTDFNQKLQHENDNDENLKWLYGPHPCFELQMETVQHLSNSSKSPNPWCQMSEASELHNLTQMTKE